MDAVKNKLLLPCAALSDIISKMNETCMIGRDVIIFKGTRCNNVLLNSIHLPSLVFAFDQP